MNRPVHPLTLAEAAELSTSLSHLVRLSAESAARLKAVESLIPAPLRPAIQPGPIDGDSWCLLVQSNAAASKLRQLLPVLIKALQARGWEVNSIRLKVQLKPLIA